MRNYKRQMYCLHDSKPSKMGQVTPAEATVLNNMGYGIFWAVNYFNGPRRKTHLDKLISWYCEIDGGDKDVQLDMIMSSMIPSLVIESKNGYHVYWDIDPLDQDMTQENYVKILNRVVYYYGADEKAKDVPRVLRAPGYNHLKDPSKPFRVEVVHSQPILYRAKQMFYYYPKPPEPDVQVEAEYIPQAIKVQNEDLFDNLTNLDHVEALLRLSGKACVNGDVFSFYKVANNHQNIVVNGKGTSCFIDGRGLIGSMSGGGPTIWQWLRWYGHNNHDVSAILRLEIGELF